MIRLRRGELYAIKTDGVALVQPARVVEAGAGDVFIVWNLEQKMLLCWRKGVRAARWRLRDAADDCFWVCSCVRGACSCAFAWVRVIDIAGASASAAREQHAGGRPGRGAPACWLTATSPISAARCDDHRQADQV